MTDKDLELIEAFIAQVLANPNIAEVTKDMVIRSFMEDLTYYE